MNTADFETTETLRNGVALKIRAVRPADKAEAYEGLGIAGRILKHLARIARQKGVTQLRAEVLPQNKAMLAVFSRSGLPMKQSFADGVVHVTLSLTNPPEPTPP